MKSSEVEKKIETVEDIGVISKFNESSMVSRYPSSSQPLFAVKHKFFEVDWHFVESK